MQKFAKKVPVIVDKKTIEASTSGRTWRSVFIKQVARVLILAILSGLLPINQVAQALSSYGSEKISESGLRPGGGLEEIRNVNAAETRYGLVAILVESDVWENTDSYKGLVEGFDASNTRISERITRYAQDVQAEIPWTKTLIVKVDADADTSEIQRMLEHLYFEGNSDSSSTDGLDPDGDLTRLSGIVIVGEVPLPVVNKNGHRFISMLPYTDFREPAYILNATTNDFERNSQAKNLQADIWHGVIVPPKDGEEGMEMLAEYFDKNHYFHEGDEEYSNFEKKAFLGDLVTEGKTVNNVSYGSYKRFIDHWEELAYYRYTANLAEELYADIVGGVEDGDKIDNDSDGYVDEEAKNGKDDDKDGQYDEDIGDGFFNIDNDDDGDIDEDSSQDNNNDSALTLYDEEYSDVPFYNDSQVDEDPPGDSNGDGCPGVCKKDDNGNGIDHDDDGFPSGMELWNGWSWSNKVLPWATPLGIANAAPFSAGLSTNEEATKYFKKLFKDEDYRTLYEYGFVNAIDTNCYEGSTWHGEWDDDEDGYCDEDGSSETNPSTGYAYNDNDNDGQIDEDPKGLQPTGIFDDMPDIQSKKVIDTMISRYFQIFQQPIGVNNRIIAASGRWESATEDEEGNINSDYDSSMSLITQKDEYTIQYLKNTNDYFEEKVNEMADGLQEEIPIVAYLRLRGTATFEAEDDESDPETVDICDPDAGDTDCAEFVNHSTSDIATENIWTSIFTPGANQTYINGKDFTQIDSVQDCSDLGGTYEEGGQFVQYSSLYSRSTADEDDAEVIKGYKGCTMANMANQELASKHDFEMCYNAVATEDTAKKDGAVAFEDDPDTDPDEVKVEWQKSEQGFPACFEFREIDTFQIYNKLITEQFLPKFNEFAKDDATSLTEDEWWEKVQEMIDATDDPHVGSATLRQNFSEVPVYKDGSKNIKYTVNNLLKDAGYETGSDDDIDLVLAFHDSFKVKNPSSGSGMEDVEEINVTVDKKYINSSRDDYTDDVDEAATMKSVYKYTQPTNHTLNLQFKDGGTPNLPVDATRRVSFMDANEEEIVLKYLNLFDAETVDDVQSQINDLAETMSEAAGGSNYVGDIEDFMDEFNEEQLQDALDWYRMNIDEKHKYLLTHYIGTKEPIAGKARNGYEAATIIAKGNAREFLFGFNGDKPSEDDDLEWLYRSEEAISEALAEGNSDESYDDISSGESVEVTPIPLLEWMDEIVLWLEDVKDSVSSESIYGGAEYCASESIDLNAAAEESLEDSDGGGVPDSAETSVTLQLSSENQNVLQANGSGTYTVAVSARKSDSSVNTEDSYSQVTLEIVSGEESVEISGSDTMSFTEGVATFVLKSKASGDFTIRAVPANRDDLKPSNSLSGTVTEKYLKVTTFTLNTVVSAGTSTTSSGTIIDVLNADGEIVATLDSETGELDVESPYEAKILEAEKSVPTRVAIQNSAGEVLAVFFLVPDEKKVSVGDGSAGVFVQRGAQRSGIGSIEASNVGDEVLLYYDGVQIGLVNSSGQIALAENYYLNFANAGEINIFDPISVADSKGNILFTVTIKMESVEPSLQQEEGDFSGYLSFEENTSRSFSASKLMGKFGFNFKKIFSFVSSISAATLPTAQVARAASSALDSDEDGLSDLEEWTIGTSETNVDSDDDGYEDGEELISGYNPLKGGAESLFIDLGSSHEAFPDILTLYLRGVIRGYSDGSFRPNNNLSREEFLQVDLGGICVTCQKFSDEYKTELLEEYEKDPFPDEDISPELLYCVAEGKTREIVSGYAGSPNKGYFLPTNYISRAEAIKVLIETAGIDNSTPGSGEAWYAGYVRAAQENLILPDGTYNSEDEIAGEFKSWLEAYVTRAEFAQMAANLIAAQDCRTLDSEGEGLSDVEEDLVYGTDKYAKDTDAGGVNDFDEVIRGSDPNVAEDDFPDEDGDSEDSDASNEDADSTELFELDGVSHEAGVYGVGANLAYETVTESSGESSSEVKVFTGLLPADGVSTIYVQAEIRDQDGNIYSDDDSSIIKFTLSSEDNVEIESKLVKANAGKAESIMTAKTVSGEVIISAEISDGSTPSQDSNLNVYPGEPVNLVITADSKVLPAGAEATDDMRVTLYDQFNNIAAYGFHTVTFATEGAISLLDLSDEDKETDGTQVSTSNGYIDFRILSAPTEETSKVLVSMTNNSEYEGEFEVISLTGMQIKEKASQPYMLAGSSTPATITLSVIDGAGKLVSGFQGDINVKMSDPKYGTFSADTITLDGGVGTVDLTAGTLAGEGYAIADSPGFEGGSLKITFKPADPYEIRLTKEDGGTIMKAGDTETFYADIYDQYENLVSNDNSTVVDLRKTDVTKSYGSLGSHSVTVKNGRGKFNVSAESISGKLNLVASSSGLISGSIGVDVEYSLNSDDFAEINSQNLYTNLLGAAYGDLTSDDYLGGYMTFNGKAQAVSTLISDPEPKKELASIDSRGKINLLQGDIISQTVAGAGANLPVVISWRSFPDDILKGQIFYISSSGSEAVSAELLTTDDDFILEENSEGDILLRDDKSVAVKVRSDGQIVLLDSVYNMAVNTAADSLSFAILKGTTEILRVDLSGNWTKDVTLLDSSYDLEEYESLSPGIYLKPTAASSGNYASVPSGNSSANAMGLALTDASEELPDEMQPSLGYASLEKAGENGNIGWEKENKNMLLFAAGNTAGDSNKFYASEVGVLLGDPSIRVQSANETNDAGYTQDIGKMLYAGDEKILSLLNIDYNGDELEDVLISYEEGRIDVLQNSKSAERLNSRGTVLMIENEIDSISKGDFNGDELDDLLIVTKTACLADEMCLYVYENIGGGFVAQNLTLSEITSKPKQVKASDLNGDGYTDIVIFDENLNLYIIWNNEGDLSSVEKINNFGFNADESANLYSDVAITYDGYEDGSLSLTVPSDTVSGQDYLDGIESNSDYSIENSDVSGTENKTFETADELDEIFTVTKTLSDENGGEIEMEDALTYSISIKNISGDNYSEIYLSDTVPGSFEFQNEIECADCGSALLSATGDNNRPWIYGPFAVANGETLTLSYEATVIDLPDMNVMLANNIYSDYVQDDYTDIALSPEGNGSGTLLVYYSNGTDSSDGYKKINYTEKKYEAEESDTEVSSDVDLSDADGDGVPDAFQEIDEERGIKLTDSNKEIMKIMGAVDSHGIDDDANPNEPDGYIGGDEMSANDEDVDNDGLTDQMDPWIAVGATAASFLLDPEKSLDALEDNINDLNLFTGKAIEGLEEIAATFFCNGGCIAMPSNIAFLAPGSFHDPLTGTILAPPDLGTPIFGILPTPVPPVVCFGPACYASNAFRLYIAPTTTLGLGIGLCFGPYGELGQCFAFTIPLLQMLGVCDAINGAISKALSSATSFTASGENKIFNASISASAGGESGVESSVFNGYTPPVITNKNIQVPGFPEAFTEWWKKQKMEFFQMLDLPDITFIYPDPKSLKSAFKTEEGQEEVQLQTNLLGMEKFLNLANSLPIVDIKTKKVILNYPFLTPEEIEAIRKDMEQWVVDEKAEWEDFKTTMKADLDEEVFKDAEREFMAMIASMENNLAVLESYSHIPEELLKLRDLQAYYAKIIICYLDAIFNYSVGYIGANVERINAWGKWVVSLKNIVKSWQALIEVSAEFMDSCDKCTNQRFSVFQVIANLFAFLPDIPVVEMPNWPNITLDVSAIQAGVEIEWPDIKVVPQSINIPKFPRVYLPRVTFELGADLHLPDLPVLPEFKLDFQIPELPGLTLPDLPDLPPPPALPEIDPSLKASLEIVSNVLKIICIVRSNFFPIQETKLKTKIEEMTERPSNFVLPIDLAVTVEYPKIGFDFLKEIKITTYLNLKPDVSALYDVFEAVSKVGNKFTSKIINDVNKAMADIAKEAAAFGATFKDTELNVEAEAEADISTEGASAGASAEGELKNGENSSKVKSGGKLESYYPAAEQANNYKDHPLVADNLLLLKNTVAELSGQIQNWNSVTPDNYELKATERLLALDDPLLNRYDEIIKTKKNLDAKMLAQISGTPLENVATLRDSLIASVEKIENENQKLKFMDDQSFYKFIAESDSKYELAAAKNGKVSTADNVNLREIATGPEKLEVKLSSEDGTGITVEAPEGANEGIYIYNEDLGVNEKLINYKEEADSGVQLLMFDVDGDSDEDIVYSMGADVYLKENYTKSPSLKYVSSSPSEYLLNEITPVAGNVKNFEIGDNSYQKSSFSFKTDEEAIGYELQLYDSLDAEESSPAENLKRMLLLAETENELDESLSSEIGEMRASRLTVSASKGDANIYAGYSREEIESDGEITEEDSVFFQALKDSYIKVEIDGKTESFDLPAGYNVEFGRVEDRTIRVESGSVIWVDKNATAESQDIIDGMEIFAGEIINLDSAGAKVTLATTEGNEISLDGEELFVMDLLSAGEQAAVEVEIENGAYYGDLTALYVNGDSTKSDTIMLNPQICGDESAPYPVLSDTEIELPIFSTTSISASGSFDSTSEIGDVYWDLDDTVDNDNDGITNNDQDAYGIQVEIGPYQSTDAKVVTAMISDVAGNTATASVNVTITIPDIELASATSSAVEGSIDPVSSAFPFHLVRERNGEITEIGAGYETDAEGAFNVPLNDSELINVYDQGDSLIAQFNPETKQLITYDENYEAIALPSDANWPARLAVENLSNGKIMGSFLIISDGSSVTEVDDDLDDLDLSAQKNLTVHILENAEHYIVKDEGFAAVDEFNVNEMLIRNNGNVTMYDSDYELEKREAESLDEYLILDLYYKGVKEVEFYIGGSEETEVTDNVALGLPESESLKTTDDESEDTYTTQKYFEDISEDDPLFSAISELVERGILEGYTVDGDKYFYPNNPITRAEFTKIILAILCISPSEEAKLLPAVFSDILKTSDWYYSYTKESFIRELISGYLGETDSNGQSPFKPNNTISRAEAAKIMLEALDKEEIIELPDMSGSPWYSKYIEVAQDFSEYMKAESAGEENYIITSDEAAEPGHLISRYEFVEMSVRALKAYNCYDIDTDGDGLTDYEEENTYKTNPLNEDTDGGGILDGDEIERESDPVDQEDDFPESPDLDLSGGVYAVQEECKSCPCEASMDYDGDLQDDDKVFAIIQNDAGEILGKSNELSISSD